MCIINDPTDAFGFRPSSATGGIVSSRKFFSPHDLLPTGCFRFSHLFLTHLPSITIGCAMCIQSAKKQSQQIVNSLSDAIKSMTQPETLLFFIPLSCPHKKKKKTKV